MFLKYATASTLILAVLLLAIAGSPSRAESVNHSQNSSLYFTVNAGQWDRHVYFRSNTGDATMWFAKDGAYYQFGRQIVESSPDPTAGRHSSYIECLKIKASFLNTGRNVELVGEGLLDHTSNYFLGDDPSRWQSNVPNFETIVYRGIYPGINLRYYENTGQMEYDFIVSPGGDPSRIQIRYDGVEAVAVNEQGELEVTTAWGTVTERRPYLYQEVDGATREVAGRYLLLNENSFGFEISGNYDPNLPLVIDPVLIYSSYLGGSSGDYGWEIELDESRDMYMTGQTFSADFPMQMPLQGVNAGNCDIYITKMALDGTLLYSTYFGGSLREETPQLALDDAGCAYVVGRTFSPDLPTYAAYDPTLYGNSDLFVLKLNSTGDALVFSTYLGGEEDDYAADIDVDPNHNAYVTSTTTSPDFPVVNPFQVSPSEGTDDLTLTKFSVAGDMLEYSTYLGGIQDDCCMGMAVDDAGCAYLVGFTYSRNFPLENAFDSSITGCDAFLTKFMPAGNAVEFSTYLGGSENEWAESVALDNDGNIYLTGGTRSTDFPLVNPFQPDFMGGTTVGIDNFVCKFNPAASALVYSTYLGGTDDDFNEKITVDKYGMAFVTGYTYSVDYPLADPIYGTLNGGTDISVTAFSQDGTYLVFSTFLGGSGGEEGEDIAIDDLRNLHIAGYTGSGDYPLVNPFQSIKKGTYDAIVSVIEMGCCNEYTGNADFDEDDLLNILDVSYLVQWLYVEGPAPECEGEVDVNGNDIVGNDDLFYLIEYMWYGGPGPVPCH